MCEAPTSSEESVLVYALTEELARRSAENTALQCQLAAERMIAGQIFAAMEAIDPQMQGAVLGSLHEIAAELETRGPRPADGLKQAAVAHALAMINACILRFTGSVAKRPGVSRGHLHLVADNPSSAT